MIIACLLTYDTVPAPGVLDTDDRPRPLTFDLDQHKVLNSELKYLYTAVTRARVNVWIFDEDANARAPMFEYFRACHLVEVVTQEGTDASQQGERGRVQGGSVNITMIFKHAAATVCGGLMNST